MTASFAQVIICLLAGIALIILLTAKYRVHPFFALLIACFFVGLGVQIPFLTILSSVKDGFGNIMRSLGLIIVMGTTLGVLLEHSGCTKVMANTILKLTGEKKAPLAMSITGFIVGLPVFCDSGFIVLSGLNQSLAKRTAISVVIMSVSLATGLYAVHCLLPPHPGAAAAAVTIGVDFGKLVMIGILVAIPGMIVGHLWARYAGKKTEHVAAHKEDIIDSSHLPSALASFLPVIVPLLLITANSLFALKKNAPQLLKEIFSILGEPVIALTVGVLLVLIAMRRTVGGRVSGQTINKMLFEAIEKAGSILIITAAGGSFGAVLAATNIGQYFSESLNLQGLGILFPFLLAYVLKTAQGSSTVAIITTANIVLPLLPALGLDSENGKLLAVLAMGAGSMMISHANDSYYWVIAKFSGLDMKPMLKVYSVATIWMGLVTIAVVYVLSLLI